jgi:5'-nucleotidase
MVWRSWILSLLAGVPIAIVGGNTEGSNLSPGSEPLSAEAAANPWPPPQTSLSWSDPAAAGRRTVHLQLLGFNDFHGNLQSPTVSSARPVGGAAALAAYLKALERAAPGHTLIVHAGDQLGASPPITGLLHNEPAIEFLNLLANSYCHYGSAMQFFDAAHWRREPNRCNVVGTLGNHEFDAGPAEIRRLLEGGNAPEGPFLEDPYRGSRVPYVCANVIDRRTGKLLLPAYAVVVRGGIPVGVIGAVLRDTPSMVPAWAVADLEFLDEAESINRAASELARRGIHTIIVLIHQGLVPVPSASGYDWQGPLRAIVARLDPDIDVVLSGHTHNYTNALLPARGGAPVLVTQAYAYGVALAQIDLRIDPVTRDVVTKSARIVPIWADSPPGQPGDPGAQRLTDAAQKLVAASVGRVVGTLPRPVTRALTAAGESTLGDLVADAQRAATHADMALMNPGGLRSDLRAGPVTWGDVLTLHPFANHLITLDMTGAQLLAVLEQQWPAEADALPRILKTSGLYYSWDPARPVGARIVEACDGAYEALDPARHYRVTVNDFLANGGDGFTTFKGLGPGESGPLDRDALEQYLQSPAPAPALAPATSATQPRTARADLSGSQLCSSR